MADATLLTDPGYADATGESRLLGTDAGTSLATAKDRLAVADLTGQAGATGSSAGWSTLSPSGDTVTQSVPCACCDEEGFVQPPCWGVQPPHPICAVPYPEVLFLSFPDLSNCPPTSAELV